MTDDIYKKIDIVVRTFQESRANLMRGNCGTFAIALAYILKDIGVPVNDIKIVFILDGDEEDLFYGDTSIYHILLDVDGYYIDGDGMTKNANKIMDWVQSEYGDYSPSTITFDYSDIEDKKLPRVIRSNTQYDTDIAEFLEIYRGNKKTPN